MKGCLQIIAATLIAAGSVAPQGHAQQLQTGTWSGELTYPNYAPIEVAYKVVGTGESLGITLMVAEDEFAADSIRLTRNRLRFVLIDEDDGNLRCNLRRRSNGRYRGQCTPVDGEGFSQLVMIPPRKETPEPASNRSYPTMSSTSGYTSSAPSAATFPPQLRQ